MRLAEIIALRPVVAAGLLVMLTRRCPLHCAHCSTASTMTAAHTDADALRRFFATFRPGRRPEVVMLTGGEPLLRPALVTELAAAARAAGSRTAVLTGAFFARNAAGLPDRLRQAVRAVDHVSVSVDAFHEREVPRADVFRLLRRLLDQGTAVSLHLTGTGPDDPYLAGLTGEVTRVFGGTVPMLVGQVRPAGRAAAWASSATGAGAAVPCAMAAWPVVTCDGAIAACCNQDVVDGPDRPDHLRLGHIGADTWADIATRTAACPVLRTIRTLGPAGWDDPRDAEPYCTACRRLGTRPAAMRQATAVGSGPVGELLDWTVARRQAEAGPVALVRRYGCAPYAPLVDTDARPTAERVR